MSLRYRIAVLGTGYVPAGSDVPPAQIRSSPDFEAKLVEPRAGFFPGTPFGRGLTTMTYLEAGMEAAQRGFDGLFINTFGDYAIAELRSALDIPVVGAGDAGLAVAAQLGQRITIVTIWPSTLEFIYRERLSATAQAHRVTSVRYVLEEREMASVNGDAADPVARLRKGQAAIVDRVVQVAQDAVQRERSDVILLGCTCMAPAAAEIAMRLAVPVVDPLAAGYAMTEALVRLRLRSSRHAYPKPDPASVAALSTLLARGSPPGSSPASVPQECPVCVVEPAGSEAHPPQQRRAQ